MTSIPESTRQHPILSLLLTIAALLFAALAVPPAFAGWAPDGIPLTTSPMGNQTSPVIIPDGAGGTYVAWVAPSSLSDCAPGSGTVVYVQRLGPAGEQFWGFCASGMDLVLGLTPHQSNPLLVSDGSGGVIVFWEDKRNADPGDVFAQHYDADGSSHWPVSGGVVVASGAFEQTPLRAVATGGGTSVIVWKSLDAMGTSTIFSQKLSATGALSWGAGGVAANPGLADQRNPDLLHDGGGGVYIVFEQYAGGVADILATRLTTLGAPLWAPAVAPVCAAVGDQVFPRLPAEPSLTVVWEDHRGADSDVYAQRLIVTTGAPVWAVNGVPVCVNPGNQRRPVPFTLITTHLQFFWQDDRNGDWDIYGQDLTIGGFQNWTAGGKALVDLDGDQTNVSVANAKLGGMALSALAWEDTRRGNRDVFVQEFDLDGSAIWAAGGVLVGGSDSNQDSPVMRTNSNSELMIAWCDRAHPMDRVFAQWLDADGAAAWGIHGLPVTTFQDPPFLAGDSPPKIAGDGTNGTIAVWASGKTEVAGNIYARGLDPMGVSMWGATETVVCSSAGAQRDPVLAADGSGGGLIAWIDARAGFGTSAIYAQYIDRFGAVLWTANGVAVCTAAGSRTDVQIAADASGGAIICWSDSRGADSDIYLQHLSPLGVPLLASDGIPICAAAGDQLHPHMVADSPGQAAIVWEDHRAGVSGDIYAHHFLAAGFPDPAWPVDGAPVCVDPADQTAPQVDESFTIAWQDARGLDLDIFADRINPVDASSMWSSGLAICGAAGDQRTPRIVRAFSVPQVSIITWDDQRGADLDVYAQKVNAAGAVLWSPDGVGICTASGDQSSPLLAADGTGGVVLSWIDTRDGDQDIYCQRVESETGASLWAGNGVALCTAYSNQDNFQIASDGTGGVVGVWEDFRWGPTARAFAGRIAAQGGRYVTAVPPADVRNILQLEQNAPNPFNPVTRIGFSLPSAGRARLDVFDVQGRLIARLMDGERPAGRNVATWNGIDRFGRRVAAGVYVYRLEALGKHRSRRMVLLP